MCSIKSFIVAILVSLVVSTGMVQQVALGQNGQSIEYDLTGPLATEIVLDFGDEALTTSNIDLDKLGEFYSTFIPSFTNSLISEIGNTIDNYSSELQNKGVVGLIIDWGYPDTLSITIIAMDESLDLETFPSITSLNLPQPLCFPIKRVIYVSGQKTLTEVEDTFLKFDASITDLPEGFYVDVTSNNSIVETFDGNPRCIGKSVTVYKDAIEVRI